MILADGNKTLVVIVAVGVTFVVFGALAYFIVKGQRWFYAVAARAQDRAFDGVAFSQASGPGLVLVVFHTYFGVLVFTHQTEYRFWAKPADARLVLARLNHFNWTWGFFAYGGLIIPILSLGNYWAQLARIRKQAARLAE